MEFIYFDKKKKNKNALEMDKVNTWEGHGILPRFSQAKQKNKDWPTPVY